MNKTPDHFRDYDLGRPLYPPSSPPSSLPFRPHFYGVWSISGTTGTTCFPKMEYRWRNADMESPYASTTVNAPLLAS